MEIFGVFFSVTINEYGDFHDQEKFLQLFVELSPKNSRADPVR